jgi:hypothetical protein
MSRSFNAMILLFLIVCSASVSAWGPEGHRAVARIAEGRLSAAAKAAVASILGSQSMAAIATWADDVRNDRPETKRWHYTDVPITAASYSPNRDCQKQKEGDCSLAELLRAKAILVSATPQGDPQKRREALMFLVHIVGDIHQPLHAAERNNDAGGNLVTIGQIGGATRLHAAWDSGIINASGMNETSLVAAGEKWLMLQGDLTAVGAGTFESWSLESHKIAQQVVYPQAVDGKISDAERVKDIGIIEERVARAGFRLATVLNEIFGTTNSH